MIQEDKEKIRNILYNNKCIADYKEEDPFVGIYFSDLINLLEDYKLDLINAIDYKLKPLNKDRDMCYIMTATGLTLLTSEEAKEFYGLNKTSNKTNISMNIAEDYCSFELSKLLKEKGFKQEGCHKSYSMEGPVAPTHQMAMKWLREVHNTHIVIDYHEIDDIRFYIWVVKTGGSRIYLHQKGEKSYEEACEAAIKYSLENLV